GHCYHLFFFQAEDGIRDRNVTGVQTCALPIYPRVRPVENPDPSRGMFSSIQEGVAQAQGDTILVMPGDMPFISPETVRAVIAAYERKPAIVSPRYRGKRGHAVALPAALRGGLRGAAPRADVDDVVTWLEAE